MSAFADDTFHRNRNIKLEPVTTADIERTLNYWDPETRTFDRNRAKEELFSNALARYVAYNVRPEPLRRILSSVFNRWNAFGILESPYIDLDFWDNHTQFYSRCFFPVPVECERLHFFSIADSTDDDISYFDVTELRSEFLRGLNWEERFLVNPHLAYRGYCVLRPLRSYVVGRTAIQFDDRRSSELPRSALRHIRPEEEDGRPCLLVPHAYKATLLNTRLTVANTAEFLQKDPNLGFCATASLWVASQCLSQRFNLNKFSYSTITQQAQNRGPTEADIIGSPDSLTTPGLFPSEIRQAISRTGAHSLVCLPEENGNVAQQSMRLQQELYSFVESGIPVILLLTDSNGAGHAVTAVGHNLPAYETVKPYKREAKLCFDATNREMSERHYLVSSMCPVFYTHDDRYGPFNRLTFAPVSDSDPDQTDGLSNNITARATESSSPLVWVGGRDAEEHRLEQLIIPVPAYIRTTSHLGLGELLSRFDFYWQDELVRAYGDEVRCLWRSMIVEGSAFKESLVRRSFSQGLMEWYGALMLPKYVWLYEISLVTEKTLSLAFSPTYQRNIHGEFLLDTTSSQREQRCLASRFLSLGRDYRTTPDSMHEEVFNLLDEQKIVEATDCPRKFIYSCFAPTIVPST